MTEESRYTIDDAPEPPVPEEEPSTGATEGADADTSAEAAGESESAGDAGRGSGTREAWSEVLTQLDALADSMGRWAKAAVNDPENRRHAAEIRAKLDAVGAKIGSAVDEASKSDIGRSVHEAADKTGQVVVDAGGKVAQEAAPAVASVLAGFADLVGKAAEKVGKAAERKPASEAEKATDESQEPAGEAEKPAGEAQEPTGE